MKRVTLLEFRRIVRRMVNEYVANTDDDVHKDVHADPTAKAWDAGLDEEQVELGPVDPGDSDIENFECNACGYRCPGYEHGDYNIEGTCPRCSHDNTMDDDPNETPQTQFQESDDDHSEEHGGKRVGDPRWDDHADPTGKSWDSGLDGKE